MESDEAEGDEASDAAIEEPSEVLWLLIDGSLPSVVLVADVNGHDLDVSIALAKEG